MKEILYYLGNTSFCLLVDESTKEAIARGVAICNHNDQFVKREGRAKARGRAKQATIRKMNISPILAKQKIESWLGYKVWKGIDFYATFLPDMTEYEKELVARAIK